MTPQESDNLRVKILATLKRLEKEGRNIYKGMYYGGDAANVQLSASLTIDGDTTVTYCFYNTMYNFKFTKEELKP